MIPKRSLRNSTEGPCEGQKRFLWEPLEQRLLLSADSVGAILGDGAVLSILDREQQEDDDAGNLAELISFLDASTLTETTEHGVTTPLPDAIDLDSLSRLTGEEAIPAEPTQDALLALLSDVGTSDGTNPDTDETGKRLEILFIDSRTPDYQQLLDGIAGGSSERNMEIVLLDPNRDGIEQISETLAGHPPVDAIHIISHGSAGVIQLGSSWLSQDSLPDYVSAIEGWSEALSAEADLLLYGCNLAANDEGQALIRALSGITGADVAASDDPTGNRALGGDWDLEYRLGALETMPVVGLQGQENWTGMLLDNNPVFTANGPFSLDENSAALTVVGNVDANDGDGGAADAGITYSITVNANPDGDGNDAFSIDGSTGVISVNDAGDLDFEGTTPLVITVQADDGFNQSTSDVTINLSDINDTPTIVSDGGGAAATVIVREPNTPVTTVAASAPDAGDTLSYSIVGGSDQSQFSIDSGTGVLSFNAAPDFENPGDADSDNVYEVTIQVGDGNGGTDTQALSVSVDNVTETLSGNSILLTTPRDITASGAPGLGAWSAGEALEFGSITTLEPGMTDGTFGSLFNLSAFAADSAANMESLHYVAEGITVGSTTTFDLFEGDIIFATRDSETLTSTNSLSVTRNDIIVFRPDVADGYTQGTFELLLENPFGAGLHAISLVTQDTLVGDITVSKGSFLAAHTGPGEHNQVRLYSPDNVGAGNTTGTLETLLDGSDIGFSDQVQGIELVETQTTIGGHTLSVGTVLLTLDKNATVGNNNLVVTSNDVFYLTVTQTTKGSGTTIADATLLFEGADVGLDTTDEELSGLSLTAATSNQAPTAIALSSNTVDENSDTSGGHSVGTLSSTDADSGDTHTYTINGGADAGVFGISGNELILTDGILDFETKSSYSVTVRVTDSALNTHNEAFAVNVNDLNEVPSASDATFAVDENSANGTPVGTVTATDPDAGVNGNLSYAITAGNTNNAFAIDGSGNITVNDQNELDFETSSSYALTVTVTDGGTPGLFDTAAITVNVNNSNDAPTVSAIGDTTATEDAAFSYDVSGNFGDVDVGDTLSYSATLAGGGALPGWLSIDGISGIFSGTPANSDVGSITVEVTADDGRGGTVSDQFTLTAGNGTDAPTVSTVVDTDGNENNDALYQEPATSDFNQPGGNLPSNNAENRGGDTPESSKTDNSDESTEKADESLVEGSSGTTTEDEQNSPARGDATGSVDDSSILQEAKTNNVDNNGSKPALQMKLGVQAVIQAMNPPMPAWKQTLVSLGSGGDPLDLLARRDFLRDLDDLRDNVNDRISFNNVVVGSTMAISTGFSVGYVAWLARSGALLSSVLTSLPAWHFVDPLPVLAFVKKKSKEGQDDDDDDSLESMVKKSDEEASANA